MNIALVGYGKMNHAVEEQALLHGHEIVYKIDNDEEMKAADLSRIDVALEFSMPSVACGNVLYLIDKGINVVSGTTGCQDGLPLVKDKVEKSEAGVLWSPNFSIGVNIFWKIVANAVAKFDPIEAYDVFGHEFHHNGKADSPSGTAVKTAQVIINNSSRKQKIVTETLNRKIQPEELHFTATRGGAIPGTHSVYFDSPADTVEIKHTARSKAGFALGAVLAGEWIVGKKGWFTMDDFLEDFLKKK